MAFNTFMHERNIYKNQPDFAKLASDFPEFHKHVIFDGKGQKARVDFSNTETLRTLTKILLKKDFNLDIEIPEGFLIPTVPQRLNYILWIEDLLSRILIKESKEGNICGIDIGTGTCAIFAVLGARKNDWKFIATESSEEAIIWAKKNIEKNNLQENISVVKVNHDGSSLDEVLSSNGNCYHFCMCNPPFFENSDEIRKKHQYSSETIADVAQKNEIFVKGGELDFVRNILKDSLNYKNRIRFFTSMFGKKKSFLQILKDLKEIPDVKFTNTQFFQGNTIRWGVAWTFDQSIEFEKEVKKKLKPKKAKPPLEYEILINDSKKFNLNTIVKLAKVYLRSLEIHFTVVRSSQNFTELLLKSDKNTWTHQRRKRRELERQKKEDKATDKMIPFNENVKTLIKDNGNAVMESSNTDAVCSTSHEVNAPDKVSSALELQKDTQLLSDSESEHKINSSLLKNNKRKLDLDSDDSASSKKIKIDDTRSTKIIPIEKSMLSEDTRLTSNDETVSNCGASTHSVSKDEQHSVSSTHSVSNDEQHSASSDDTKTISSNKNEINSLSNTKNVCNKMENSEGDYDDHKNNEDTEPEGLVLHCYLQFLKGKNKVHVKMNCPPSADRNIMYQVFQLVKNKIDKF